MLPAIPRRWANNSTALISTRIPMPRSAGIGERGLPTLYPATRPSSPGRVVIRLSCHSGSSGYGFFRNLSLALLLIEDIEYVFVLVLHHIVCDGPSIAILLEELALFYAGFAKGVAIHIPEPRVQYADFAAWQREALVQEVRATQLAYWKEQLRDCLAALDLPSDRSRSVSASFRGGMEYRQLSQPLSEDFRSLARQHGVTRFMALLALFEVLLSRYTGQEEVSVGCPMTHRIRAEVSRVVGFFANMMVLRSRLEGNPTFRELLQRTREVALGAYAHQDLPFEQLVAELQPERVPGRNP